MPNKKINQLDSRVLSSTDLLLIGDPVSGVSYKSLVSGLGLVYVPYTGATGNIALGEYGISGGYFQADLTPTMTGGVGRLIWNDTDGTLDLGLKGGNVTLQIGQEQVQRVVNKTGGNLLESAYQVVKVTTAQGQRLAVDLAQADNDANSADTLGLVTETINNNLEGFITTSGLVRNINTTGSLQGETWNDGDILYLSPTTPGAITKVKPTAPNHSVILGYVVYAHSNNGKIFVKCENGYESSELHDIYTPTKNNNDGIFWVTANNRYESKSVAQALGFTPVPTTRTLTINGTAFDLSADRSWTISGNNIYNADGTLTGHRLVTMSNNRLTFAGGPIVQYSGEGLRLSFYDGTTTNTSNSNIQITNDGGGTTPNFATFSGAGNIRIIASSGNKVKGFMSFNVSGSNNTFLNAYNYNTTLSGDRNTAISTWAYSGTTGSDNTLIGSGSGFGLTTGSGNIQIGISNNSVAGNVSNSFLFGDLGNMPNTSNTICFSPSITSPINFYPGGPGSYNGGVNFIFPGNANGGNTNGFPTIFYGSPGGSVTGTGTPGNFQFRTTTSGSHNTWLTRLTIDDNIIFGNNSAKFFYSTGNLHIGGTSDGGEKLQVTGTARTTGKLTASGGIDSLTAPIYSYDGGSTNDRAGLGISSSTLNVFGPANILLGVRRDQSNMTTSNANIWIYENQTRVNTIFDAASYKQITAIESISSAITASFGSGRFHNSYNAAGTTYTQYPILSITRSGESGVGYDMSASFGIRRRIVGGNTPKTTLDLNVGESAINGYPDVTIMTISATGIGINNTTPNASAMLDIASTTKGFLPPRMTTTEKNAISAVAGLVVYDTTTNKLCCYNGTSWNDLF